MIRVFTAYAEQPVSYPAADAVRVSESGLLTVYALTGDDEESDPVGRIYGLHAPDAWAYTLIEDGDTPT